MRARASARLRAASRSSSTLVRFTARVPRCIDSGSGDFRWARRSADLAANATKFALLAAPFNKRLFTQQCVQFDDAMAGDCGGQARDSFACWHHRRRHRRRRRRRHRGRALQKRRRQLAAAASPLIAIVIVLIICIWFCDDDKL